MFVGDAIDCDVAWEPEQEANALLIDSSLLSAIPVPGCICSLGVILL